jgi:alpha-L-rhamnosidase
MENGKPVKKVKGIKFLKYENGKALFEIESGIYKFTSEI